ncbi:hypothetical protein RRF57_004364 [Xylaria bambusicola]|uniref:Uncharacterized protein n=1 Tax=Xylaria bambusicola TaxID=326684 RepID=A0AAN7UA50_9PEZI
MTLAHLGRAASLLKLFSLVPDERRIRMQSQCARYRVDIDENKGGLNWIAMADFNQSIVWILSWFDCDAGQIFQLVFHIG